MNHIIFTEKVDVYSFGIMVWQMATDNVPFKGMTRDDFIARVAKRDERPAMERSVTSLLFIVDIPSFHCRQLITHVSITLSS